MLVFFDPGTHKVSHVVNLYPENYPQMMKELGQTFSETDENIPVEQIEIMPDGTIARRQPMNLAGPSTVQAGAPFEIEGIPAGTEILINGDTQGVMDESSSLELEFDVAGVYLLTFKCAGFIRTELRIEAQSNN